MSTLAAHTTLPSNKALRDMLLDLLGRDVTVAPSPPWSPAPRDPAAIAVYVDDSMKLRAIITCNLPLSVALGASIALIPAKAAAGCIKLGALTQDISDNLYEVLNILSALFNLPDRPHVKLYSFINPDETPPADITAQLRVFGKRADLKVEVAGYGGGLLSLVVL